MNIPTRMSVSGWIMQPVQECTRSRLLRCFSTLWLLHSDLEPHCSIPPIASMTPSEVHPSSANRAFT
jgi:hypothetical protein